MADYPGGKMNLMDNINIHGYAEWRDGQKRRYDRNYSRWLSLEPVERLKTPRPHMPDWSWQAYIDAMIEGMPKGIH